MTAVYYFAAGLIVLEALVYVAKIGKPRQPVTHFDAICGLVEWSFFAFLMLHAATS